ncbi:mannosyltransferase [Pleurotus ostreatus]|uniref:Mannosyltransferase n=1 Tax=Pleurotus ostreatus TaxID=5322 RepID=A0A8H7A1P6_PLEOS|nr:mannosyltransferase [Pleurotus ostreatus]KAF7436487.1 mannosyltransferase [Pleurotus ostreatus]
MATNAAGVQHIRLRKPEPPKASNVTKRHTGLLQDKIRRSARAPWAPSFSMAVRILLLVRFSAAMYSNISDCDEVFNFWEPLHFLDRGHGFQTWEVSPEFSIRSWAYVLLHLLPTRLISVLVGPEKRPAFFAVRISLAVMSVLAESKFYRTAYEKINEHVGRYLFFMLLTSAGMWNSSAAFLPSSFTMCTTMMAFSYALDPPSNAKAKRTLLATVCFTIGAVVGWPFALALAIPFVFEEIFVFGGDRVPPAIRTTWSLGRLRRFVGAVITAAMIFIPVIGIDSLAYGHHTVVPWNIIRYNIFGGSERGPELYGTSPWYFYLLNLFLNFNILVPLALISLPALAITYRYDHLRLGAYKASPDQSSPFTLLTMRLLPFYIWFGILSLQAHKEERFMFPAYPLLCLNAAVALYLIRGWQEAIFISITKSPYKAAQSSMFRTFTLSVIVTASVISISRILALWTYYHSPMTISFLFETEELPRLLNVTGFLPPIPPNTHADEMPRIDLSPIKGFNLTLCYGKEWYRFPGHYLVPDGVRVDFIKSEFDGMLPGHFGEGELKHVNGPSQYPLAPFLLRPEMRLVPAALNDLNREAPSYYVPVETCDYIVDLDFPKHPVSSANEPRYAVNTDTYDRVACIPFLDARHSSLLTRTLWMPGEKWQSMNEFGDYCLLRNRERVRQKEEVVLRNKL